MKPIKLKKAIMLSFLSLAALCATAQNRLNDVLIFTDFPKIRNFFVTNTSCDNNRNIGLLINKTVEWNDSIMFLYQIDTTLNIIQQERFQDFHSSTEESDWTFCGYKNGIYYGFISDNSTEPTEEAPYWDDSWHLFLVKKRLDVDSLERTLVIRNMFIPDSTIEFSRYVPFLNCNGEFFICGCNPEGNFNLMLVDTNGQITATNQIAVHNENVFFKAMGDSLGYLAVSTEDSKTIYGVNLTTLAITDTLVYMQQGRLTDFIIGKNKELITVENVQITDPPYDEDGFALFDQTINIQKPNSTEIKQIKNARVVGGGSNNLICSNPDSIYVVSMDKRYDEYHLRRDKLGVCCFNTDSIIYSEEFILDTFTVDFRNNFVDLRGICFIGPKLYMYMDNTILTFYDSCKAEGRNHGLGLIGITDLSKEVSVYPNPVTNVLNVTSRGIIKAIEVFNPAGDRIYRRKINEKSCKIPFDNAVKGTYLVKVTTSDGTVTEKIIKQ
ncbi:MAG: T9SS type A sorting domain-containing protein [Bacteroidales bacterium]|nr:T9SS type A sorting domain-containing protein [Bacteroidales bacterium]